MDIIREWFRRNLSDPQVVTLALLLIGAFAVMALIGRMLAPVIAALVIAYLLDSPVEWLRRRRVPKLAAVVVVFVSFIGAALFVLFTVLLLLTQQVAQLVATLPSMLTQVQELLLALPERYPQFIDENQVRDIIAALRGALVRLGQQILQFSLNSVTSVVTVVIYVILVPLMVFFFLKDKRLLQSWVVGFLPTERALVDRVWREVDLKTGHYIRGKAYEVMIVGSVTWATFEIIGLQFTILLGVVTGLSVLIPFVGAALVTFPVALVAIFQWGPGTDFFVAVGAYLVIQALDGNLLAPLLFSEVVKLHPNAIIFAILVFGGLWGVWGLFFAIPLATLTHAVLNAWPSRDAEAPREDSAPEMLDQSVKD